MSVEAFNAAVKGLGTNMKEGLKAGRELLNEYSPWMMSFQPSLYTQQIEIPGTPTASQLFDQSSQRTTVATFLFLTPLTFNSKRF